MTAVTKPQDGKPKSLIINTPFVCPQQHWAPKQDGTLEIIPER